MRVIVLISGGGSNLQALLDDRQGYDIVAVMADRPSAGGIARSLAANVPTICLPLTAPRIPIARTAWENTAADLLTVWHPDLLVMAGWMRIMSPSFINRFRAIINQHPALLPPDDGPTVTLPDGRTIPAIRGAHAVRDAIHLGLPVSGCTIHRVTEAVDVGPILAQQSVPLLPGDTETTLHERIRAVERRLIVDVVRTLAAEL
ncbi:MAG: phosphoribosylglycinamide formyltransferase [Herpetosiphon sp.]